MHLHLSFLLIGYHKWGRYATHHASLCLGVFPTHKTTKLSLHTVRIHDLQLKLALLGRFYVGGGQQKASSEASDDPSSGCELAGKRGFGHVTQQTHPHDLT